MGQNVLIMSVALGGWVRARRHHLGLSQKDVATRGGIGQRTLRAIEVGTGEHAIFPTTLRALERALMWPPGSLDAAIATGQPPPAPVTAPAADPVAVARPDIVYPALLPSAGAPTMIALPAEDPAILARWIRERRTQLGLTRADAAAAGPLTAATWRALESGQRPTIRPSTRRALERALRWPPNSLDAALVSGGPPVPTPTSAGGGQEAPALAELGRWIRERRKQLGLTQLEVASAGPIAAKTLSDIECGQRRAPLRGPTRRALERALAWETGSLDAALAAGTPPPPLPGTEPLVPEVKSNKPLPADTDAAAPADGSDPFAHARRVLATLDAYRTLRAGLGDDSPLEGALAELLRTQRDAEVAVGRQMQWVAEDDDKRREAAQLIVALQQPL